MESEYCFLKSCASELNFLCYRHFVSSTRLITLFPCSCEKQKQIRNFKLHLYQLLMVVLVDGVWEPWSEWTDCSVTCNNGTQVRNRTCTGPFYGGKDCPGPTDEVKDCFPIHCPGKHINHTRRRYVVYKEQNSDNNVHVQSVSVLLIFVGNSKPKGECAIHRKYSMV